MDQPMRLSRDESTRHLNGYFQRKIRRKEAIATDVRLNGFPFDQFHCIETSTRLGFTKMEDRRDIWVPQLCSRARLAPEAFARIRVSRVARADNLERHQGAERKVPGAVSNSHRTTT